MWKILKVIVIGMIGGGAVFGFVTMHLWNWLMPALFGLQAITFGRRWGCWC